MKACWTRWTSVTCWHAHTTRNPLCLTRPSSRQSTFQRWRDLRYRWRYGSTSTRWPEGTVQGQDTGPGFPSGSRTDRIVRVAGHGNPQARIRYRPGSRRRKLAPQRSRCNRSCHGDHNRASDGGLGAWEFRRQPGSGRPPIRDCGVNFMYAGR